MGQEKTPITEAEFEEYMIEISSKANNKLKAFIYKIANYCWALDNFAVIQDWGEKKGLIAFGVPPQYRKRSNAKNYFTIFKVRDYTDQKLKCEVCFPKDSNRNNFLKKYDTKGMLSESSIKECEGMFQIGDFDYLRKLINIARCCRIG